MNPASKNLYFINPYIDYLFIGGLSVLTFVLLALFSGNISTENILVFSAGLTWVCNNPHFAATTYRLYKKKENMMQFPFTSFVVPFIVIAAILASIAYPTTVAPFFVKFFFIWSPFHFSGQSFGISMLYAKRAGFKMGNFERQALKTFIYASFIAILFKVDVFVQSNVHYNLEYLSLGAPLWFYHVCIGVMIVAGLCLLFSAIKWSRQKKKVVPPIVFLPAITHVVWFIGGEQDLAYNALVPFFHSAQYLFIAWAMQLKDVAEHAKENTLGVTTNKTFAFKKTIVWMAGNCVIGALMFEALPLIFPSAGTDPMISIGIVIVGVQIHHFFVDGVIWKLKDQHQQSPLLINMSEYIESSKGVRA